MYDQIGFKNSVYRFKDGRMCDFSFIGNEKNVLKKFKVVKQNLGMQRSNIDFLRQI